MTHAWPIFPGSVDAGEEERWPPGARGGDRAGADMSPEVVAIFGPTASGKTSVAERVAEGWARRARLGRFDAGLPRRADPDRAAGAATRLVAIWPLSHEASVAEYAELAHAAVDDLLAAGRTPVVAGGTGLYLRAALADLRVPPAPPPGARERWEQRDDSRGATAAHAILEERDPAAAAAIHANDRRRVVRALELTDVGASLRPPDSPPLERGDAPPDAVSASTSPPDELERRIERRAHAMVEAGAIDEARRALAGPLSSTAQHVLGLRACRAVARRSRDQPCPTCRAVLLDPLVLTATLVVVARAGGLCATGSAAVVPRRPRHGRDGPSRRLATVVDTVPVAVVRR